MSGRKKDNERSKSYIDSGIDLDARRISFGNFEHSSDTDFDQVNVLTAMRAIQKMLDVTNTKPIELHFMSYGGDISSMFGLVDLIETSGCDFHFYGYGCVMSAATFVMAICKPGFRFLSEHTRVMVHEMSSYKSFDKVTNQHIDMKENLYLQDKMIELYAKKTFMDETFWHAVCKRDLYLSPQEAIKLGLADKIIPKRKRKASQEKRIPTPTEKKQIKALVESIYRKLELRAPGNIMINLPEERYELVEDYDNSVTVTETPRKEPTDGKEEKES